MAASYALRIGLESYEYQGEFYLVGEGYGTAGDVLEHVATDHILRIARRPHVEEYLLEVLAEGDNVSNAEYEELDADISCGIHVDVDHQQYSFWVGDRVVEIGHDPTESQLASIAADLRS